ncbi:MAG TPA: dipeptidase PepV [Negativicutes bacterium]|nr:dipeptidase PepV [Negativicutes bacterium]
MNQLNVGVDNLRAELIGAVQDAVKIRSVQAAPTPGMPFGPAVAEALDQALVLSRRLGFRTVNVDGYMGYAEYGEGRDYVAAVGHLDIVPEGGGWTYPPYGGEIHAGKLFARGALDDKGPIIAALYGLKAVKDSGLPLAKRVRILYGTNEETGCDDAAYYLTKEPGPMAGFTPDGMFPVIYAEKGIFNCLITRRLARPAAAAVYLKGLRGGERPNIVPDACQAVLVAPDPAGVIRACEVFAVQTGADISASVRDGEVHIQSRGLAAHGSTPELGVNAIMQLMACLGTCGLAGHQAEAVAALNKYIGRETDGQSLGIALADEPSGDLTLNAGLIELTEDKISLICNIRFPVTIKFDEVIEPLRQTLAAAGFEVNCDRPSDPLYFPRNHSLVTTLSRIFAEHSGTWAEPLAIGGGTYAKSLPNIVAFGPELPGQSTCAHEPNECIGVDELVQCAKIYAQAIYELAR